MQLAGTDLLADAFAPHGTCLISHAHTDHLDGLDRVGARTRVYCTAITARVLAQLHHVPAACLHVVSEDDRFTIDDAGAGVRVRTMPANHCPGAVMFHVEAAGRRILYTGDFRLDDGVRARARELAGVDMLYVDSTYDQPHYRFPPQRESIAAVLDIIRAAPSDAEVYLGVYTIGKTRLLRAVVEAFGRPFYASAPIRRAYRAMALEHLVTGDKEATRFRAHARGYFGTYFKMSRSYRDCRAVVIIPTGWAVDAEDRDPRYHYVPYSEHCDYAELQEFIRLVGPREVVAI